MRWLLALVLIGTTTGCDALFPTPKPPIVVPVPSGAVQWVYVLEETQQRTPEIAAVLADPFWTESGIKFRVFDRDVPDAKDIVDTVGAIALPAVVLADATGRVLYRGPLPLRIEDLKTLISRAK